MIYTTGARPFHLRCQGEDLEEEVLRSGVTGPYGVQWLAIETCLDILQTGGRIRMQREEIFGLGSAWMRAWMACWAGIRWSGEMQEQEAALGGRRLKVSEALAAVCAYNLRCALAHSSPIATFSLPIQLNTLSSIILFISSPSSRQFVVLIAGAVGRRPGRNDLHADKREKVRHGSVSVETSTKPREFHGRG